MGTPEGTPRDHSVEESSDPVSRLARRFGVSRELFLDAVAEVHQASSEEAEMLLQTPPSDLIGMRERLDKLESKRAELIPDAPVVYSKDGAALYPASALTSYFDGLTEVQLFRQASAGKIISVKPARDILYGFEGAKVYAMQPKGRGRPKKNKE